MVDLLEKVWIALCGLWKYRWYSLSMAWIIAVVGWYSIYQIPNTYEARARVYVDTDSVLRPLMRGLTIDTDVSQRLRLMSRTLLTRPKLEELASMAGLVDADTSLAGKEAAIAGLKDSIKLLGEKRQANFYSITYENQEPEVARKVVSSLIDILEETTRGGNSQETSKAQDFLEQQVAEYEKRLRVTEDKLKEFKQKNVEVMSNMGDGYFQRLWNQKNALEQARLQFREAVNRRDELRRQVTGEEPVFGYGSSGAFQYSARSPYDVKIAELQEKQSDLLLRYTTNHPDVKSIQQTIEDLEAKKLAHEDAAPHVSSSQPLEVNPIYQQLKVSLGEAEADVVSLRVRVAEYEARVNRLKGLVDSVPEIEAELVRLNRNYENDKKQYDELRSRQETAKMSEEVEQSGDGVKIELIEPPRVPDSPSGPDRIALNSVVLAGALGTGIALALLLMQIFPAVYDQRTLREVTGLPVFAEISRILTREQKIRRNVQLGAFMSIMVLLLVAYGAVLIVEGSDAGAGYKPAYAMVMQ